MEKVEELVKGLQEKLDKVLARPQDSLNKEQVEKMVAEMVAKAHPANRGGLVLPGQDVSTEDGLMAAFDRFKSNHPLARVKAAPWTSEYGKKFGDMRNFLKALKSKDESKLQFVDFTKASSDGQTEGTNSTGGFLVPTDFEWDVIVLLYANTVARQICRIIPMSTLKRTLPSQLTNVAVTWVGEFAARGVTSGTFGQFTQTAKVMAAVIKSSDELLRDSAINLQAFLAELLAGAIGREEERIAFAGKGSVGGGTDPYDGVYYAANVVSKTMAQNQAGGLQFDDLINMRFALAAGYANLGVYVFKQDALLLISKLKDGMGRYIWTPPVGDKPGQILDKPYYLSDMLPTNVGVGNVQTPVLYGDFKDYLWISDRAGLAMLLSQEASDWVGGALDSAFMSGQTWMRFTKAMSIDVAYGAAFCKMPVS